MIDCLHKISTTLSKKHTLIAVEALNIKNMSKSAQGIVDEHGRNVKDKYVLNKSISAKGWDIFRTLRKYKI